MAKRSSAREIKSKQSSAYAGLRGSSSSIHAIDGSSKREASRRLTKSLKSFPGSSGFVSQDYMDAQAEKIMNKGYSKRRNPVCSSCFSQKSTSGSCNCD